VELPTANHPGASRHPSLSKEGKFHNSNRMAIGRKNIADAADLLLESHKVMP